MNMFETFVQTSRILKIHITSYYINIIPSYYNLNRFTYIIIYLDIISWDVKCLYIYILYLGLHITYHIYMHRYVNLYIIWKSQLIIYISIVLQYIKIIVQYNYILRYIDRFHMICTTMYYSLFPTWGHQLPW